MHPENLFYLAKNSKNYIHIKNSYIYVIFVIKNQGTLRGAPPLTSQQVNFNKHYRKINFFLVSTSYVH
jgi:hypothetical protein